MQVTVVCAISLDGKLADASRGPVRFPSARDRERLHALRDAADAIIVGASTIRAEDPPLLPTEARSRERVARGKRAFPVRAVFSRTLDLPIGRALSREKGAPLYVFTEGVPDAGKKTRLEGAGASVRAHVFRDAPDHVRFGFFYGVRPRTVVTVPFTSVVMDRKADVAVCLASWARPPEGYAAPGCLPLALGPEPIKERVLLTIGYPMSRNTPTNIGLDPAAFASDAATASWIEGPRATVDGEVYDGRFLRLGMKALKGGSGAPLCAFDLDAEGIRVQGCRVVGIQSLGPDDDKGEKDPSFAYSYFAEASAALRLRLPAPYDMELGAFLEFARPHQIGEGVSPWIAPMTAKERKSRRSQRPRKRHK